MNNINCKTTLFIIINISKELINRLNIHEGKSIVHLINILEALIKKELKLQAGYDVYFKHWISLHQAALNLLYTLVSAILKAKTGHIKKKKT